MSEAYVSFGITLMLRISLGCQRYRNFCELQTVFIVDIRYGL